MLKNLQLSSNAKGQYFYSTTDKQIFFSRGRNRSCHWARSSMASGWDNVTRPQYATVHECWANQSGSFKEGWTGAQACGKVILKLITINKSINDLINVSKVSSYSRWEFPSTNWGHVIRRIDPWPLRAKGLIVLVSPNYSDRKGNNKVSKWKLKKYLFGEKKTKEKPADFDIRWLLLLVP